MGVNNWVSEETWPRGCGTYAVKALDLFVLVFSLLTQRHQLVLEIAHLVLQLTGFRGQTLLLPLKQRHCARDTSANTHVSPKA